MSVTVMEPCDFVMAGLSTKIMASDGGDRSPFHGSHVWFPDLACKGGLGAGDVKHYGGILSVTRAGDLLGFRGKPFSSSFTFSGLACFCLYCGQAHGTPHARRTRSSLRSAMGPTWQGLQFWLGQWKHPRFRFAGIIHILIFTGFIILISRAGALLLLGITDKFATSGAREDSVTYTTRMKDYAATLVLLAVIIAAIRRTSSNQNGTRCRLNTAKVMLPTPFSFWH